MTLLFGKVCTLLPVLQLLLMVSLQAVKSRTVNKPHVLNSNHHKENMFVDVSSNRPSKRNMKIVKKDHLNSVLPLVNLKTFGRGGRAVPQYPAYPYPVMDQPQPQLKKPIYKKECNGTKFKLNTRTSNVKARYRFYKKRYQGCQIVRGNLEIVFLHNPNIDYDMSFLKDIREVTGYVLIAVVFAKVIPLTSLEVIRGETLYHGNSLYVTLNYSPSQDIVGLWELQMPSLSEISRGDVVFRRNNYLCFTDTIVWGTIMKQADSRLYRRRNRVGIVRACGSCHYKCHDHCWGEGADMCQSNPNYYYR